MYFYILVASMVAAVSLTGRRAVNMEKKKDDDPLEVESETLQQLFGSKKSFFSYIVDCESFDDNGDLVVSHVDPTLMAGSLYIHANAGLIDSIVAPDSSLWTIESVVMDKSEGRRLFRYKLKKRPSSEKCIVQTSVNTGRVGLCTLLGFSR